MFHPQRGDERGKRCKRQRNRAEVERGNALAGRGGGTVGSRGAVSKWHRSQALCPRRWRCSGNEACLLKPLSAYLFQRGHHIGVFLEDLRGDLQAPQLFQGRQAPLDILRESRGKGCDLLVASHFSLRPNVYLGGGRPQSMQRGGLMQNVQVTKWERKTLIRLTEPDGKICFGLRAVVCI